MEEKLLLMLAQIINRASASEPTTTDVRICRVPANLLKKARNFIRQHYTNYESADESTTIEIRQAAKRVFYEE